MVNRIKRVAHIKNWFKPVVSSKLLDEAKHEYRRVYFPRGRGKLSLLAGYQGRASGWDIVNHPLHQFILNRYSSSCNLRQRRAFVLPKTNWIELNWIELDWFELNWIGFIWIGFIWIGSDWFQSDWFQFQSNVLVLYVCNNWTALA